ncbi:hypothetical protein [Azospirillum endophyticum]
MATAGSVGLAGCFAGRVLPSRPELIALSTLCLLRMSDIP